MLHQSSPSICVLEQPQHELISPCWVFTNTMCGGTMLLEGGKCAMVDKILISPKVLEDAWLFNNNRFVTVLLCNYQHKGRPFFCLLKQHSFSIGL